MISSCPYQEVSHVFCEFSIHPQELFRLTNSLSVTQSQGRIQSVRLGGRFQKYLLVKSHYGFATVRDEVYITTQLWQNNGRQNVLVSRMLFSKLYKILVNKVTFVSLRRQSPPWIHSWPVNPRLSTLLGVKAVSVATGVRLATSDCCLFQHRITSGFYVTVAYKLKASITHT